MSEPDRARLRSERFGFVFQSFNLLARTSAIENVALPLFYAGLRTGQRAPRGPSGPAQRWDCSAWANASATRLANFPAASSSALPLRAPLINRPGLLLADEPTGNLDTRTSHEIMETLTRLNREQGVTIVVVTHEADIAAYADRVLTMRDGQIVSDTRNPKPAKAPATARHRQIKTTRALPPHRSKDHGLRRSGHSA